MIGKPPTMSDLTALKRMPLTKLNLKQTSVVNLSPLEGMGLNSLERNKCPDLFNLSPLKGMKLTLLDYEGTNVSDLSVVVGMPLTR